VLSPKKRSAYDLFFYWTNVSFLFFNLSPLFYFYYVSHIYALKRSKLSKHKWSKDELITATVITGKGAGQKVLIPRMDLVPSDSWFPLKNLRRQFPVQLCFAMKINKSQGQSLSKVGLYLPRPVFTHGQLYVAVSRVTTKKWLKMLILDEDDNPCTSTLNVVFPEVFSNQ